MSLNKLTDTQKGLDIGLQIGCEQLDCNVMNCGQINMPNGADLNAHDIEVDNELKVNGSTDIGGNNYLTPDLGLPNYSLHTDGAGNCFWSPDDTGSGDITYDGTPPTIAGQLVKFSGVDGKTAQQSTIRDDGGNLNMSSGDITNVGLVDGVDVSVLETQVNDNTNDLLNKVEYNGIPPTTAGQLAVFNSVDGSKIKQDGVILTAGEMIIAPRSLQSNNGNFSGVLNVDNIVERTLNNGVSIEGCLIKDNEVKCDNVNETTLNNGVNVDGVLIKDGLVDGVDVSVLDGQVSSNTSDIGTLNSTKLDKNGTENCSITNATPACTLVDNVSIGACNGALSFKDSVGTEIALISAPPSGLKLDSKGSFITADTPELTLGRAGANSNAQLKLNTDGGIQESRILFSRAGANKIIQTLDSTNTLVLKKGFPPNTEYLKVNSTTDDFNILRPVRIGTAPTDYTLPNTRGSAGQILKDVAGNGVISWENDGGGGGFNQSLNTTDNVEFNRVDVSVVGQTIPPLWANTGLVVGGDNSSLTAIQMLTPTGSGTAGLKFGDGITNNRAGVFWDNTLENIVLATTGVQRLVVDATEIKAITNNFTIGTTSGGGGNQYTLTSGRGTNGQYLQTLGNGATQWASLPSATATAIGETYFLGNALPTNLPITNTYTSITGVRNVGILQNFTALGSIMTYTGTETRYFKLEVSIDWEANGSASRNYQLGFFKNAVLNNSGQMRGKLDNTLGHYPRNITTSCLIQLSTNDTIEVRVRNLDDTQGLLIQDLSFNAISVGL
jgi:hypothetical protein